MRSLITAFASALPAEGIPDEIVYLPEGEHRITPFVNGKAQAVTVKVPAARGTQIAASLQTALDRRQKANVRPWFDFEHKAGVASALPKSFRYEPGRGVMAAVEWTGAGRAAIEGKDFSYFSPVFFLGEDGVPDGLPERGPLGALVNEPAFREIPRIAASDAVDPTEETNAMSLLILATCGLLTEAEAALPNASDLARQRVTAMHGQTDKLKEVEKERDDAKAEVERMKTEAADARKERAKTLVEAAQADGRIAAKDEETARKFREKIEAGDSFAEEILAGMQKQHAGLDKPIIQGGAPVRTAGNLDTQAQALITAGQAKDLDEARGIIFASDATAYSEYLASLK